MRVPHTGRLWLLGILAGSAAVSAAGVVLVLRPVDPGGDPALHAAGAPAGEPDRRTAPAPEAPDPAAVALLQRLQPHLSPGTLSRLQAEAAATAGPGATGEPLCFACHVVEGRTCMFIAPWPPGRTAPRAPVWGTGREGGGAAPRQISAELAVALTDELNPRFIEHAQDNEVRVCCVLPAGNAGAASCEIDWGFNKPREALQVSPEVPPESQRAF